MVSILAMSSGSIYRYTTMTAFTTFLWFDSQAEQAAQFYTAIFKDSAIDSVQRYTAAGPGPEGQVMLVEFTINGQPFAGLNGGPQFTFTPAISFVVPCADQAEVDYYWDALLADGGVPNACGWLTDKFGVSWQVVPTRFTEMMRDGSKAEQVTRAMLAMSKFDIVALEEAYSALFPALIPDSWRLFLARTLGRASSSSAQPSHQVGDWRTARSASLRVAWNWGQMPWSTHTTAYRNCLPSGPMPGATPPGGASAASVSSSRSLLPVTRCTYSPVR
jgi:predicted 3-demethylubiquinone-9 3-methyltransferase (glyoxalase superfamily)